MIRVEWIVTVVGLIVSVIALFLLHFDPRVILLCVIAFLFGFLAAHYTD